MNNSQYHTCEKGSKDYVPGHGLKLKFAATGFDFEFSISAQDWYDPVLLGKEAKDWLKAGGVSYLSLFRPNTWPKNHLSALVGFRMLPNQRFEACAYVNDLEGNHRVDAIIDAAVGQTIFVQFRRRGKQAKYILSYQGKETLASFNDFDSAGFQVAVGPWHGGTLPAPVKTGIQTSLGWA